MRTHLVVLLEDVVHLGHVLAGDGLDDVALVVGGVEAGAAPPLGLAVQWRAPRQRVLPANQKRENTRSVRVHRGASIALLRPYEILMLTLFF
jgi:hypothetical protein